MQSMSSIFLQQATGCHLSQKEKGQQGFVEGSEMESHCHQAQDMDDEHQSIEISMGSGGGQQ